MKEECWLLLVAALAPCVADAANNDVYIEFLWDRKPAGSIARQQTIQFLTDGRHDHQVCVATNSVDTDVGGLSVTVLDASAREISHHVYPGYRGTKQCYSADLGSGGQPGRWTFRFATGDGRTGESDIQVHAHLEDSPLAGNRGVPYVVGRPNYDASIPPEAWSGRLVWDMTVDADGRVYVVSVVTAEGVGAKLSERAIAAGYMSLFFPDPQRASKPLVWRRELAFAPE